MQLIEAIICWLLKLKSRYSQLRHLSGALYSLLSGVLCSARQNLLCTQLMSKAASSISMKAFPIVPSAE